MEQSIGKSLNVYGLLEQLWVVPAIVKGVKLKIWEDPKRYIVIAELWKHLNLLNTFGDLTQEGVKVVECSGLLEYECRLIGTQLDNDNAPTDPVNYELLRDGLAAYCKNYLWDAFTEVVESFNLAPDAKILDYCGGAGSYLECLLTDFPDRHGTLVDKNPQPTPGLCTMGPIRFAHHTIDFKKEGAWYQEIMTPQSFDLIILNEIFHCLGRPEQHYLLTSARAMLKPDGVIIVGEQQRNFRLEWRMKTYTDFGQCLDLSEINQLAEISKLTASKAFGTASHWFALLRKENQDV